MKKNFVYIAKRIAKQPRTQMLLIGSSAFVLAVVGMSYHLTHLSSIAPTPLPQSTNKVPTSKVEPAKTPDPVSGNPAAQPAKPAVVAQPSQASGYGFSAGDLPGLSSAELEAHLSGFNSLGVTWIRFDVPWNDVQPDGPTHYDWSGYDRVVTAANKHKLQVLMLLDYTPAWARRPGCADTNRCAPSDNAQFAVYAAEVVKRYSPQGVKNWEIWNEPNHVGAWEPAPDAQAYTDLLIKTYAAIKKVDPSAFVMTGGAGVTYTEDGNIGPADFMRAIYKYGGKGSFDGVGQHPYTFPALASLDEAWTGWHQMLQVRSVMAANGDAGKPIWLTEFGAPTNGPGAIATPQNFNFEQNPDHVDEALQQQIALSGIELHKNYNWTGPLFWYGYKDLGTDPGSNENFFGLLRADGTKKPAYAAFQSAIKNEP